MRVHDGGARRRWGGTLVESAVVGSLALMLLLGTVVVGTGVFRYQQVASLAREGSRYASLHGKTQPDGPTIKSSCLLAYAAGMDPNSLSCTCTWGTGTSAGTVTVRVAYTWVPEAYFGGSTFTLSSTSSTLITNFTN